MVETNLEPAGNTLSLFLQTPGTGTSFSLCGAVLIRKIRIFFLFSRPRRLRFLKFVPQFPYFRDQRKNFLQEVARAMLVSRSITVQAGGRRGAPARARESKPCRPARDTPLPTESQAPNHYPEQPGSAATSAAASHHQGLHPKHWGAGGGEDSIFLQRNTSFQ